MAEFLENVTQINTATEDNNDNLIWIDVLISGTPNVDAVYGSRRVTQKEFKNLSKQFSKNNIEDLNGFELQLINGKRFVFVPSVSPTIGEASFSVKGFGTTAPDLLFDIYGGANNRVFWVNGLGDLYSKASTFYQFSDTSYAEYVCRSNNISGACQIALQNGTGSILQIYGNNAGVQIISAQPIQQSIKAGILGNGSIDNNQLTFGYDNTLNELIVKFKKADGNVYSVNLPATLVP
jgi:hypothetical protein